MCVQKRVCASLSQQLSLIDSCRPSGLYSNLAPPSVIRGQGSVAPRRRAWSCFGCGLMKGQQHAAQAVLISKGDAGKIGGEMRFRGSEGD